MRSRGYAHWHLFMRGTGDDQPGAAARGPGWCGRRRRRRELSASMSTTTPARIAQVIRESGHSRFLVGKGGLDDVACSIVHVRSLLDAWLVERTLIFVPPRPAFVLHDNMPMLRALEALRQARVSIALVVDEYGEVEVWSRFRTC